MRILWLDASSLGVHDELLVVVAILAVSLGHRRCDVSDNNVLSCKRKSTSRLQLCKDSEWSIRNDSVLDCVYIDVFDLPLLVQVAALLPDDNVLSVYIL